MHYKTSALRDIFINKNEELLFLLFDKDEKIIDIIFHYNSFRNIFIKHGFCNEFYC